MSAVPFPAILTLCFFLVACNNEASKNAVNEQSSTPKVDSRKSIPSHTSKQIGNAKININYTAPAVRGRAIWGDLVPYNKVWVTGAHNATTIEISKDFLVGATRVPAGKYAIFTIPSNEEWTVILNKNWDQHLADEYDTKEDVVRLKVKPVPLKESVERLTYEIDQAGEKLANISMNWEKLQIKFGIQISD